jgi:hypothetical protein
VTPERGKSHNQMLQRFRIIGLDRERALEVGRRAGIVLEHQFGNRPDCAKPRP